MLIINTDWGYVENPEYNTFSAYRLIRGSFKFWDEKDLSELQAFIKQAREEQAQKKKIII